MSIFIMKSSTTNNTIPVRALTPKQSAPASLALALVIAIAPGLSACGKNEPSAEPAATGEDSHAESGGEEAAGELKLDAAALTQMGVELQPLQAGAISEELRAPGEVIDSAYGTTLVTPRVVSLVIRRHVKLGDEVRAGAPLVTLSSVDVANAQADLRIAEQEARRVSALGREAVSGRRISEAQVAVDRARAVARAYGLPGTAPGGANGEFTLTAPHAGRITEDDFVVGERIEPGKALFRLVDESVVWVDAKLPSGSVPRITPGSEATVVFNRQRLAGKVLRAAHRTSDATRNASVRVEVPNHDDVLHGGDFVEVLFEASDAAPSGNPKAAQLSVPNDALVQLQGETIVFRRNARSELEPVPVRTGEVIGDHTVVREGLKAGDAIVVQGAFAVKSQMLKSQLGEE